MLFAAGAVLFAAFYLRASADLSRVVVAAGTVVNFGVLAVARTLFLRDARRIIGGNPYNVVLLSDEGMFPRSRAAGFSTILAASSFDPGVHDPMMYDRLAVALQKADRVVVACAAERRHAWVHALQGANVQGEVLAPELTALAPLGVARFGEDPTLIVAKGPLGIEERMVKRLFDIVVAGVALLLLAPMLGVIALAIRVESPGSVFFVQRRIGRGNRMFHMLKFRSMRPERCDENGCTSTTRDDDRITRVGRLLRRTSLDELPQLVNVLAGNMSIVGPRPHALGSRAEDQLFWEIDERYWHRHAAKPGLTGLAQIRGYRGATNHRSDLVNRLQADLEYLHGWTIWRDMLIVAQTVRVLVHRNAF
ncbi:lipopolysaccharide/colanic/teichoic acid biosynthesis glycosyltransferase [Sphingomonas desiccabilis]|nr:lipopolysaccharide/colanic/teichoic acid biosynthesis glycosyltransferase [Sphingomonas desiccabilis]